MFDIVSQVIGGAPSADVVFTVCGVLAIVLTVKFIEIIGDIIRSFMRG